MEPDQLTELRGKVERILAFAYHGIHHVPGWDRRKEELRGVIEINVFDSIATWDFDQLTRLVIGAHNECCRMEIRASGPRLLKLVFHNRSGREGAIWDRHPDILTVVSSLAPREEKKDALVEGSPVV